MTRQRQLIYDIIMSLPVHLTAEEIYAQAHARMPAIARGTVYRNLGLMVAEGQIAKLELTGGACCYDRTVSPHAHLVCRRCGALKDLMLPELAAQMSALSGEEISDCSIALYYLCENCR